jgi:hypothetical protein
MSDGNLQITSVHPPKPSPTAARVVRLLST